MAEDPPAERVDWYLEERRLRLEVRGLSPEIIVLSSLLEVEGRCLNHCSI
jgi:hypothetical protein